MIACYTAECTTKYYIIVLVLVLLLSVAGTPNNVTARRTGYTSVLVFWTAPLLSPAGYDVFYQTPAGDSSRLSGGNTSNTELTLTGGLTPGETYYIFVVAFGEEGLIVHIDKGATLNLLQCLHVICGCRAVQTVTNSAEALQALLYM